MTSSASITITPEQFQRALDAVGAVPMAVAYPKEYAEAIARCAQKIADDIDREILEQLLRERQTHATIER